jgi:hypothetical protein
MKTAATQPAKRIGSVRSELLTKAREAALSAVQTFNNPLIAFKSETFIVLMIIAWTYLMHAYYRRQGVEYRYFDISENGRRKFHRTKRGTFRFWELERCLSVPECPVDAATAKNLLFLIGLRHEIEHQMALSLDNYLSGRYQACALNFNRYIKAFFGEKCALDRQLAFSIQFAALTREQIEGEATEDSVPAQLKAYIFEFDEGLSDEEFNSEYYSYRVLFTRKLTGKRGQADSTIEFIAPDSPLAKDIDTKYWVQKEVERPKLRAKDVVQQMRDEGFTAFGMHQHTQLWKVLDAKNPGKGFGVDVAGTWYWYERWADEVRAHCRADANRYRPVGSQSIAEVKQPVMPGLQSLIPEYLRVEEAEPPSVRLSS